MDVTMPHSCEVTADRLAEAVENHSTRLSADERAAFVKVRAVLHRIAAQDRRRMADEV